MNSPDPANDRSQPWFRNLIVLWLGCFCTGISFSLVMPFLPAFVKELGVETRVEEWTGIIFAITFLASAIMSPIWGSLADRYGRKIMILRSGIFIAIAYFFMARVTNHWQLFGLRFVNGIFSGFIPSSIALIATNTPEKRVGRSLSILQTGIASGNILGPVIGGILADLIGLRHTMTVAASFMLLATVLVIFFVTEEKKPVTGKRTRIIDDYAMAFRTPALLTLMFSILIYQTSIMSLEPILTPFISQISGGTAPAWLQGAIFSLPGFAVILAATSWASLGERKGYPRILFFAMVMAALFILPQGLAPNPWVFAGLRFVFGIFLSAIPPMNNSIIATEVDASFRGRAYGITQSSLFMGNVLGPTLGGFIAGAFGANWVFVSTGLLLLVAASWVYYSMIHRPSVQETQTAEV